MKIFNLKNTRLVQQIIRKLDTKNIERIVKSMENKKVLATCWFCYKGKYRVNLGTLRNVYVFQHEKDNKRMFNAAFEIAEVFHHCSIIPPIRFTRPLISMEGTYKNKKVGGIEWTINV